MRKLCIGVTGHRSLADPQALERRVEDALQRLHLRFASAGLPRPGLTVASALAEGADRLVAQVVLRGPGAELLVVLPLRRDDYRADFTDAASGQEFDDLLARADTMLLVPPSPSRDDAYAAAGRAVLAQCDVLIALWDGLPARGLGGTAELVAEARALATPLIWIRTDPPFAIREERIGRIVPRRHPTQRKPASTA